ncbi:MAG: thioredoxin-disulfide reductase [Patescibacteria group bacterium]|jgi:thioredoxin reductase (NADPH)
MYDIIVVGGGPAGLTAGLYTSRRTLSTLIIAKDLGGQMASTTDIENYPGFENVISGFELASKMKKQAEKFGAKFILGDVSKIEKKENGNFLVHYNNNKEEAQAIILAFGLTPRNLDVPGEQEFKGKGVTYCANCDAPLYKNKIVAVVGGGNSALDAADYLSKIASKVYLIHRRDQFRGEEVVVKEIVGNKKIEILYDSAITEIKGDRLVKGMTVKNLKTEQIKEVPVNGVFIEVGRKASTEFLEGVVGLNEKKEVVVDYNGITNTPGIFACGDITNVSHKQIAIATGEGVKAALSAYMYLLRKRGQSIPGMDWGKKV